MVQDILHPEFPKALQHVLGYRWVAQPFGFGIPEAHVLEDMQNPTFGGFSSLDSCKLWGFLIVSQWCGSGSVFRFAHDGAGAGSAFFGGVLVRVLLLLLLLLLDRRFEQFLDPGLTLLCRTGRTVGVPRTSTHSLRRYRTIQLRVTPWGFNSYPTLWAFICPRDPFSYMAPTSQCRTHHRT